MNQSPVEQFGRLLTQCVRDAAVRSCDQQLNRDATGSIAKRWREQHNDPNVLIPDCVDETIFHLLRAIDQDLIKLSFTPQDGLPIDLTRDGLGELAGLFMASGGWRSDYSSERFADDFGDLA